MNLTVRQDLYRYVPEPYSTSALLKGLRSHGFRYMFFMRKAAATGNPLLRFLYRLCLRHYVFKYGFQIPYNTRIGGGFHISHIGAIVINTGAVIGSNCNINPGVVIGQSNRGKSKGFPTLGDRVWLGANSVVVGKVTIGNDVLIAPGAFVNFDVPDHSIVLGNPGKIIPSGHATIDYVCNVLPENNWMQ
jgi:serine O-acetyltransferase